jgi:hypothetical protein
MEQMNQFQMDPALVRMMISRYENDPSLYRNDQVEALMNKAAMSGVGAWKPRFDGDRAMRAAVLAAADSALAGIPSWLFDLEAPTYSKGEEIAKTIGSMAGFLLPFGVVSKGLKAGTRVAGGLAKKAAAKKAAGESAGLAGKIAGTPAREKALQYAVDAAAAGAISDFASDPEGAPARAMQAGLFGAAGGALAGRVGFGVKAADDAVAAASGRAVKMPPAQRVGGSSPFPEGRPASPRSFLNEPTAAEARGGIKYGKKAQELRRAQELQANKKMAEDVAQRVRAENPTLKGAALNAKITSEQKAAGVTFTRKGKVQDRAAANKRATDDAMKKATSQGAPGTPVMDAQTRAAQQATASVEEAGQLAAEYAAAHQNPEMLRLAGGIAGKARKVKKGEKAIKIGDPVNLYTAPKPKPTPKVEAVAPPAAPPTQPLVPPKGKEPFVLNTTTFRLEVPKGKGKGKGRTQAQATEDAVTRAAAKEQPTVAAKPAGTPAPKLKKAEREEVQRILRSIYDDPVDFDRAWKQAGVLSDRGMGYNELLEWAKGLFN